MLTLRWDLPNVSGRSNVTAAPSAVGGQYLERPKPTGGQFVWYVYGCVFRVQPHFVPWHNSWGNRPFPNRHISSRSKKFCTGGVKMWRFSGRMWQKTSQVAKIFSCARASHSSQKCDKCDASHFLSPKKETNVTSPTQIWDWKLGRNLVRTDPNCSALSQALPGVPITAHNLCAFLM